MRVGAFMNSLQARLNAEQVPYSDLDCRWNGSKMNFRVSLCVSKFAWIHFEVGHNVPIQYIREVVYQAGMIALKVQEAYAKEIPHARKDLGSH